MSPKFEFDDGHSIEINGPVVVNPANGENAGEENDTNVFLPQRTLPRVVEDITDAAEQLRSVSLKKGEPASNLIVDGVEKSSVFIPLGHDVVVHSS